MRQWERCKLLSSGARVLESLPKGILAFHQRCAWSTQRTSSPLKAQVRRVHLWIVSLSALSRTRRRKQGRRRFHTQFGKWLWSTSSQVLCCCHLWRYRWLLWSLLEVQLLQRTSGHSTAQEGLESLSLEHWLNRPGWSESRKRSPQTRASPWRECQVSSSRPTLSMNRH